jgi:glycosyltransferase involved in cell wall biosynthesis
MPSCSVAIPVYNQQAFIDRAIGSALDQNVSGLQVLVIDNHSTDGTWEAIQKYARYGVRVLRNPHNVGLFGNFNRCLEASNVDYLRLLSGDDYLPANCLASEVDLMERNPRLAMVSTRGRFVDRNGRNLGSFAADFPAGVYSGRSVARAWFLYYAHYRRNFLNYPSGVLFRLGLIRPALRFDERFATAGDIDFFLRVLEQGDLAITNTVGSFVTRHPSQAHTRPNLDGTAVREHLSLLDSFKSNLRDDKEYAGLRSQFAGMCLGLAAYRFLGAPTRHSAVIHFALARSISSSWPRSVFALLKIAACRLAGILLDGRAPYIPRPIQPFHAG